MWAESIDPDRYLCPVPQSSYLYIDFYLMLRKGLDNSISAFDLITYSITLRHFVNSELLKLRINTLTIRHSVHKMFIIFLRLKRIEFHMLNVPMDDINRFANQDFDGSERLNVEGQRIFAFVRLKDSDDEMLD